MALGEMSKHALEGIFGSALSLRSNGDEPRLHIARFRSGDLSALKDTKSLISTSERSRSVSVRGTSAGLTFADCETPAVGEAIERYCASMFSDRQFIVATAQELGQQAIDLDTIAVCSSRELSDPKCPLRRPDKTKPIRWVKGLSLFDGTVRYVPAILVYMNARYANPDERFWLPITSGCASHTSFQSAILSAICELVERDATSILWLQRLGIPRIHIDCIPAELKPYWEIYERSSRHIECVFFDATTDIGLPTVYGIQRSPYNSDMSTIVASCTSVDPMQALIKVIREFSAFRRGLEHHISIPADPADFTSISHGAIYMGKEERFGAFHFLFKHSDTQNLSTFLKRNLSSNENILRKVVHGFHERHFSLFAVDLSSDEATRMGARVVRVIAPDLQPLGFNYRARYLGHRRLYDAPSRMGYFTNSEPTLNQWPQPFA